MIKRRKKQESLQTRAATSAETPSHPTLLAALLMIGIVAFIFVMSLVPLL